MAEPTHLKAAMFGAIGPDIFDSLPGFRDRNNIPGLSFKLHNNELQLFLRTMLTNVFNSSDRINEWQSQQRAYLYGYVSHIISDSLINPFVFYFSGYKGRADDAKAARFYRERFLLFQYTVDAYYRYHHDDSANFNFRMDDMLPCNGRVIPRLAGSVSALILGAFQESYPDIYSKLKFQKMNNLRNDRPLSIFDFSPFFINALYKLKMSGNRRLIRAVSEARRKNFLTSDIFVMYPRRGYINRNILNLHRGKWQNPAGVPGFRYDSINNLVALACEKTVDLWTRLESCHFSGALPEKIMEDCLLNAYTGSREKSFSDMAIRHPARINFSL
jgi:hypothetical protein